MRRIGKLPEATQAERFCDYLVTLEIESSVEPDPSGPSPEGGFDIWIRNEADVDRAREELARFREEPESLRYDVQGQAHQLRKQRQQEQAKQVRRQKQIGRLSAPRGPAWMGGMGRQQTIPVTIGAIAISVIVGFLTNMGRPIVSRDGQTLTFEFRVYSALSFVDRRDYLANQDGFASLKKGQVWRIITPMFLHGDPFHLLFNMVMLYVLGSAVERLHGSWFYLLLLLGSQTVGILVQVLLPDWLPTPLQGSFNVVGASGAVYGLFGFLWMRPKYDPGYPIQIPPSSVAIMIGWLLICMTPLVPNVANGAHAGGLLAGVAAAALWRVRS